MKKLTEQQKTKLIYSLELGIFSIIFLVLGVLKITQVMPYKETRRIIFNWITLFGSLWGVADFIWAIASKKRRTRVCLLDKALILPLTFYIISFDLISLIKKPSNNGFYIYMIGFAFLYIAVIYSFQAIYHFYKPIPGLLEENDKANQDQDTL